MTTTKVVSCSFTSLFSQESKSTINEMTKFCVLTGLDKVFWTVLGQVFSMVTFIFLLSPRTYSRRQNTNGYTYCTYGVLDQHLTVANWRFTLWQTNQSHRRPISRWFLFLNRCCCSIGINTVEYVNPVFEPKRNSGLSCSDWSYRTQRIVTLGK